jgi:hypothetical protein
MSVRWPFAERRDQVDDAVGVVAAGGGGGVGELQAQALVGIGSGEAPEVHPGARQRRVQPVDRADLVQRGALPPAGRGAQGALHPVAGAEPQPADQRLGDEHVAVGSLVAVGGGAEEAAAARKDLEDAVRRGRRGGERASADGLRGNAHAVIAVCQNPDAAAPRRKAGEESTVVTRDWEWGERAGSYVKLRAAEGGCGDDDLAQDA